MKKKVRDEILQYLCFDARGDLTVPLFRRKTRSYSTSVSTQDEILQYLRFDARRDLTVPVSTQDEI